MESGTAAMEAITTLLTGPFCLLVAYAHVHKSSFRHPLQLVVCTMQLYGLLWFTLQPLFTEGGVAGHFSSDPVRYMILLLYITSASKSTKRIFCIICIF